MKIAYVARKFKDESLEVVKKANAIIQEYKLQGFALTLRQLYYQFVSRDFIPNNMREYKKLGALVNNARLAGLIDWDAIEDRTRNLKSLSVWTGPAEIIAACVRQFRIDKWDRQPNRVEVWIEKDALTGVIQGICDQMEVPYFSCRGYTSQSEMHAAAKRLESYQEHGQEAHVIHLGDHDPSGKDMTDDITRRFDLFMNGAGAKVHRIALNMDQIKRYNPPPNPAKETDSRYDAYVKKWGPKCYELDALEPSRIVELIEHTVLDLRDQDAWDEAEAEEEKHKQTLETICSDLKKKGKKK